MSTDFCEDEDTTGTRMEKLSLLEAREAARRLKLSVERGRQLADAGVLPVALADGTRDGER